MGSFVLGASLALALVFVTAGVGKLLDPQGSRRALAGFGIPDRALSPVATLLPLAELATAIALIIHPATRWGGLAALLLLLAFIAGIANALSRGHAPDCHCFGQIHSAPAGLPTLARNAGLAALAAVVTWRGPGPALDSWISARTGAELAAVGCGAAALILAALAGRLWQENRSLRRDLAGAQEQIEGLPPGLPIGASAPGFALRGVDGETITLDSLRRRGKPVLLVFAGPVCGPCWLLYPHLRRWQATLADRLTVAIVSTGTLEENRDVIEELGVERDFLQDGADTMRAYRADATPTAVVVNPDGQIASTTVVGGRPIEPLVRLTLLRGAGAGAVRAATPRSRAV